MKRWAEGSTGLGVLAIMAVLALAPAAAVGQVPATVTYQGYLTDGSGVPVDGTVAMDLLLFANPAGGSSLWSEYQPSVQVGGGIYSVQLGSVVPLDPADFTAALFLEVWVNGEQMSPRQPLTSVPFALNADTVDGQEASDFAAAAHAHSGADITSGRVPVSQGGTGADLSATGGAGQFVKQSSVGGDFIVAPIMTGDIPTHTHDGSQVTSGTVSDLRIPSLVTRDNEVMTWVLVNDGPGSTLNADLLDGMNSGDFAATGHDHFSESWSGSTVSAALEVNNTSTSSGSSVKGKAANGPTDGYLGVQGNNGFDGTAGLDIEGFEIGVLGVSTGGTISDNYGVYGYSNNVGVYGESATGDAGYFAGDVKTTGDYRYASPKTYAYSIPGSQFASEGGSSIKYSPTGHWYHDGTNAFSYGYAPVHLPEGASVTDFTCYAYDNDAASSIIVTWHLDRRLLTAAGIEEMAEASVDTTGASPSIQPGTAPAISFSLIDNANYFYQIWGIMYRDVGATSSGNLRNYGCRIEYTVAAVAP